MCELQNVQAQVRHSLALRVSYASASVLAVDDQYRTLGHDCFASSNRSYLFARFCFDTDLLHIEFQDLCHPLPDFRLVRRQFRLLGEYNTV